MYDWAPIKKQAAPPVERTFVQCVKYQLNVKSLM